ncbi:hypothetical protein [Planctomicrobium sp. SH527]|uniref:hypothetical protein n=1 Tax=Planctomicrobium sp. SH527 TaxID=3448123 RepID=UPI003F5BCE10
MQKQKAPLPKQISFLDPLELTLRAAYDKYHRRVSHKPSYIQAANTALAHWERCTTNPAIGEVTNVTMSEFASTFLRSPLPSKVAILLRRCIKADKNALSTLRAIGLTKDRFIRLDQEQAYQAICTARTIPAELLPMTPTFNAQVRLLEAIFATLGPKHRGNRYAIGLMKEVPCCRMEEEEEPEVVTAIEDDLNAIYQHCDAAAWPAREKTGVPPSGVNSGDQDLSGYSEIGHGHTISDVSGLQASLNAKADLIGGVIPSSQLPALVKTDVFTVEDEEAMLALDAQTGDVAIRTDLSKTFIHNGGDEGTADDWSELISPTDAVTSINGLIGSVTLGYVDVGAAPAIHDHEIADISGLLSALNGKAASSHNHTISNLTDLPTISATSLANAIVKAGSGGTIADGWLSANIPRLDASNTFAADQTLSAVGSSSSNPRSLLISASTGQFGRIAIAGSSNSLQSGNGQITQLSSYYRLDLTGDRLTSAPSFVAAYGAENTSVRIYSSRPASRTLVLQGAASQTANMLELQNNAGTSLLVVNSDGQFDTLRSRGATILGAATSAVADASLGNGQMNLYLDEAGSNLKLKIKTSAGVIKTVTLAMV